jgi:ribonuclease HI
VILWVCCLWHRGQPVEPTTPLPVRFTDWLETPQNIPERDPNHLHLYTDGSRRESTGYGWTLRDSNDEEIDCGSGSLGRYHTAFDGEAAAIEEGVKAIRRCNRIFNHVSIHTDPTAAIARVQHNKCGAGQSRAVTVIGRIQRLRRRGQSIDWIKGHSDNKSNDRADYLAGQAAESQGPSGQHRVSIAWVREKISNSCTTAANIELQSRGKLTIILPPPKKSALDKARNREARIASQLRTNHWLSGVYLKRIGKRDSAGSWFCGDTCQSRGPPKMTRTHVLHRCPAFEYARREAWKDPTTAAFTRPRSIGALLGNPRWEKRLLSFLEKTNIGKVGPDKIDAEIGRITRYEDWCNLVEDPESGDEGSVSRGRGNQARGTIIVRPHLHST